MVRLGIACAGYIADNLRRIVVMKHFLGSLD